MRKCSLYYTKEQRMTFSVTSPTKLLFFCAEDPELLESHKFTVKYKLFV